MKRYEALETLFGKIDLSIAQKILNESYYPPRSRVRPQRSPLGIIKAAYKKRFAVERVFSRPKNLASLTQLNLRRLSKVTFHSQLCIIAMLLTAQAAVNTHKLSKSRSIRYFAN